jgi:hypothetical protein
MSRCEKTGMRAAGVVGVHTCEQRWPGERCFGEYDQRTVDIHVGEAWCANEHHIYEGRLTGAA